MIADPKASPRQIGWQPAETAPKDGTLIIALYADWSGIFLTRYGEHSSPDMKGELSWFDSDYNDTALDFEYWIPCPDLPNPQVKIAAMENALWRIANMKPEASGESDAEYAMRQIARSALGERND